MLPSPDLIIGENSNKDMLKNKSGIYAFFWGKICLYVGATQDLNSRIKRAFPNNDIFWETNSLLRIVLTQLHKDKKHIKVWVYFFEKNELRKKEKELMIRLSSRLNSWSSPYRYYNRGSVII